MKRASSLKTSCSSASSVTWVGASSAINGLTGSCSEDVPIATLS